MPTLHAYDYAVIRVVPRVEREEFLNVGVILSCDATRLLVARIDLDEARLLAFAPDVDLDTLRAHLAAIPLICAGGAAGGPIGELPLRARFHWLTARRSSMIQLSPVHLGCCEAPEEALEHLLDRLVRTPQPQAQSSHR